MPKPRIVFIGDSIIAGWENLSEVFPELQIYNFGIPGDTSDGVLARLKADCLKWNPQAVVLLIGTNDIFRFGQNAELTLNAIKRILETLLDHDPQLKIILCALMPRERECAEYIRNLNAELKTLTMTKHNITYFDTHALFANKAGTSLPAEFPDGLHPNEIAYHKWGQALRPVLLEIVSPPDSVA
jgi:lysophospholipase L1-like esterase